MKQHLTDALLEKILIEHSDRRKICNIKSRKANRVVDQGDNYVSLTWQEMVQVINDQGEQWMERVIVKMAPEGEHAREYIEKEGIFQKEIMIYTEILPKMAKLLKQNGQYSERLWPKMLGMHPYNLILLEDLTGKGYKKVDRLQGLNLEHATIVMKGLAKFHVLSIAMKNEINLERKEFIKFNNQTKDNINRKFDFFKLKVNLLVESMRKYWEPKWQKLADHLEKDNYNIMKRLMEICQRNDKHFNVLNHGDCWTSNLLFKYSEFTEKLCGIRFVDFQMAHYGSFAIDLQYQIHTSVQSQVFKHHKDDLLAIYHEGLLATAKKLGLTNIVIPSLASIKMEMLEHTLVGIVMSIYLLDMMLVDPANAVDLDTLLKLNWNSAKFSQKFQEKMQTILEPYLETDLTSL